MFDDNLFDQLMLNDIINDNEQKNHDKSNVMDIQLHLYEQFLKHHKHVIVGRHDEVQIFKFISNLEINNQCRTNLRKWRFFIIGFYTTDIMRFS